MATAVPLACRTCAAFFRRTAQHKRLGYCSDECQLTARRAGLRRRQAEYRTRHLDREHARKALHNAIALGYMRRCSRCEECGEVATTQGHHSDYTRPFCVRWLCRDCHAALDDGQHFGCGELKDSSLEAGATDAQQTQSHAHVADEDGQFLGGVGAVGVGHDSRTVATFPQPRHSRKGRA